MEAIKFEDILKEFMPVYYEDSPDTMGIAYRREDVLEAMKLVHNAAIERAAEEAILKMETYSDKRVWFNKTYNDNYGNVSVVVNKQSILKLKIK